MTPRFKLTRLLTKFGVLLASAWALVGLNAAVPHVATPRVDEIATPSRAERSPRQRRGETWQISVDGWHIEVDQLVVAARANDPLEQSESPAPGPFVSPYDGLIWKHAEAAGMDWRLVAAIIYEESRFQPHVVSTAGAYGLMQVRQIAALDVGETEFRDPESNIRTGVRYLERLDEMFAAARGRDRLGLVLAAYNMGPSHVREAQTLARHFGLDPNVWYDSMTSMLPLLEEPQIYGRLPSGYAQGSATVAYVERVLRRFDAHRRSLASLSPADWGQARVASD
jgi:soluble lytic murein transglycosylase-like protein